MKASERSTREPGTALFQPIETDVVIVGGGLAGLITAYTLHERGLRTQLLEASPEAGGRVATVDYGDGLRAERGMQEIWATHALARIARELGLELSSSAPHAAHSSFLHEGRMYLDEQDGSMRGHWESFLSREESQALEDWLGQAKRLHARALAHGLADPRVCALQELSYEEWVTSSPDLCPLARAWLRLHLEADLGSDWSRFSALFALLELPIFFDGGAAYHSVRGGNSKLIEALREASGPVTTSARATKIERIEARDGGHAVRVHFVRNGLRGVVHAARAVVAVPFHRIPEIEFEPALPERTGSAIGSLEAGRYTVVHLIMDAPDVRLSTPDGRVVPKVLLTNGPLGFVYGTVASTETRSVFSLLVFGDAARGFEGASRATKIQDLLEALDRIEPGFSGHVLDVHVYAYPPAAIAIWGPGRSPLDASSRALRRQDRGVYFVGDYVSSGHSDGAVRSGTSAARRIFEELERGVSRPNRSSGRVAADPPVPHAMGA